MKSDATDMLTVRLDMMSIALTDLARDLPQDPANSAANEIRDAVSHSLAGRCIQGQIDAAVAGDLGPILAALRGTEPVRPTSGIATPKTQTQS